MTIYHHCLQINKKRWMAWWLKSCQSGSKGLVSKNTSVHFEIIQPHVVNTESLTDCLMSKKQQIIHRRKCLYRIITLLITTPAILHDNIHNWVFRDKLFWHLRPPFVDESVTHDLELILLWERDNAGHATSALVSRLTDLLRPSGYSVNTVLKLLLVLNWTKYPFCPPQRLCWCLDCYSPWRPWHLSCLAPLPRDPVVCPLGWGWCPVWCRKSCLKSVSLTWWTTG